MTCPQSSVYLFYGTSVTFYICLSAIETYIFTSFLKKKNDVSFILWALDSVRLRLAFVSVHHSVSAVLDIK